MPRRPWRCRCGNGCAAAIPLRIVPTRGGTAELSAVPPRRSTVLTVFRGVTAINDGNTAELRRSWRCHCGICRTSTAVAPHLRCDGGRRSAVLTVFRGATAINDGTTAEPRRSWRCHYGLCRTSTAVARRLRCDGGISRAVGVSVRPIAPPCSFTHALFCSWLSSSDIL